MAFAILPTNIHVTQEEFNLFHNIDRQVFTRLVAHLGRDPAESMHVMALWLWMERSKYCRNLVHQILLLPLNLVSAFADEAVVILTCVEHDDIPLNFANVEIELTMSFSIQEISLRFFHGIRMTVLRGVAQLVKEVCLRAFHDILECQLESNHNSNHQNIVFSNSTESPRAFMRRGMSHQRHILGQNLSDVQENITLSNQVEEEEIVPADDRTIFLTFSKGYPITETELHNFITRRHGRDCIDAIFMQDVVPDEQPLYARLVMKRASTIDFVLGGRSRIKFSINGNHVWARKYVRKQPHEAATSSADSARHN